MMMLKPTKLNTVACLWAATFTLCAQQAPTGRPAGRIGVNLSQIYDEQVPNKRGGLIVVTVDQGYPAAEAGIRPGDVLIGVGDVLVKGRSLQEIANDIVGPAGTSVTLTLLRENSGEPIQVTVKRSVGPEQTTSAIAPPLVVNQPLVNSVGIPVAAPQAQTQSHWKNILSAMGRAANAANSAPIVGVWQGGKSENNPVYGGYYNVNFSFTFAGNGEYTEAVFMGAQQIMRAHGTYSLSPNRVPRDPTITHVLVFAPDQCEFANSQAAQIVALMALPANQTKNEFVGLTPLAGGGQMTLQDPVLGSAAAGFGLKRAQ